MRGAGVGRGGAGGLLMCEKGGGEGHGVVIALSHAVSIVWNCVEMMLSHSRS